MERDTAKKCILYLIGLMSTCFGVAVILKTNWGLDAWNGVFAGLAIVTPLSIGTWSVIIQGCFWALTAVLNKKADWFCVLPILFKGVFLDIAKEIVFAATLPNSFILNTILFLLGYMLVAAGTGTYIATGYPKMPIDGLMLALADFFSWDVKKARLMIEVTGFAFLLLVRGPLGGGTIIITFSIGYMISHSRQLAQKWFLGSLPYHTRRYQHVRD